MVTTRPDHRERTEIDRSAEGDADHFLMNRRRVDKVAVSPCSPPKAPSLAGERPQALDVTVIHRRHSQKACRIAHGNFSDRFPVTLTVERLEPHG